MAVLPNIADVRSELANFLRPIETNGHIAAIQEFRWLEQVISSPLLILTSDGVSDLSFDTHTNIAPSYNFQIIVLVRYNAEFAARQAEDSLDRIETEIYNLFSDKSLQHTDLWQGVDFPIQSLRDTVQSSGVRFRRAIVRLRIRVRYQSR